MSDETRYAYALFVFRYSDHQRHRQFLGLYATLELAKEATVQFFGADEWLESKSSEGLRAWLAPLHRLDLPEIVRVPIQEAVITPAPADGPPD